MKRKNSRNRVKNRDFTRFDSADKDNLERLFFSLGLHLKDKLSISELLRKASSEVLIPDYIFVKQLGMLEAIVKYLKEELGFSNRKISILTGRSSKSVWQAYSFAKKKHARKFRKRESRYYIPISILKNKKLGILENIVECMKDKLSLSYHEIALILNRDDRTIWTAYNRRKYVKKK